MSVLDTPHHIAATEPINAAHASLRIGSAALHRPAQPTGHAPPSKRMKSRVKFALALALLFVVVAAFVVAAVYALASRLPPEQHTALVQALDDAGGLLLLFAVFLLVGLGFIVEAFFKAYVYAVDKLAEETKVILAANPGHRLATDGTAEAARLAGLINALADRHQALRAEVEGRVQEANAKLEEEKHRLAALMSELTDSVLVCNRDGLILLYNAAARQLLSPSAAAENPGIVGLGRSIFGIIDRALIAHALELVRHRLEQGEPRPVSQFVTSAPGGQLIRAKMAPVLSTAEKPTEAEINGFVLTLDDVTGTVHGGARRDALAQSLAEDTRAALASIRAAVEAIVEYRDMEPTRRDQFTGIIRDEAVKLSKRLDTILGADAGRAHPRWPLEDMYGADLVSAIQRSIERKWGITAQVQPNGDQLWLSVDSFALVQALTYLAGRLRELEVRELTLRFGASGRFAQLDLLWRWPGTEITDLGAWEGVPFASDDNRGRLTLTLREVAQRHGGEQWYQTDRQSRLASYSMLLPLATTERAAAKPAMILGRPEFYDFDLFHQPGQTSELERRPLAELTYTVFDTETTGLDPSAGDEIISISAVRIVNGRLLRQETFDQLVDPRRPLSIESIRIHRITPKMLEGQPTIEQVLPRFARFAEDTILVGHNVAFDMRFLQLKERQTGQHFIQPVLDTLLLSAVVQPNLGEHELEANARRFGIDLVGRHTSLGDAIVTGEIFIKLIPLLAQQGIVTLKAALEASQRSYLARLKY